MVFSQRRWARAVGDIDDVLHVGALDGLGNKQLAILGYGVVGETGWWEWSGLWHVREGGNGLGKLKEVANELELGGYRESGVAERR